MTLHLNLVLHGAFIIIQSSSGIEILAPSALDEMGREQHVYRLGFYGQEKSLGRGPYTLQGLTRPASAQYFSEDFNLLFGRNVTVKKSGAHTLINIPQHPRRIAPLRILKAGSVAFSGLDAQDGNTKTFSLVDVLVFNFEQAKDVAFVDDARQPIWSALDAGVIGNTVTVHLFASPPDSPPLRHSMNSFEQMIALTDLKLALDPKANTVPAADADPGVEGVTTRDLLSLGERGPSGPKDAKPVPLVRPDDCLKVVIVPPPS